MKAKLVSRQLLTGGLDAGDIMYYLYFEELNRLAISVSHRGVVEVNEMFNMTSTQIDHYQVIREVDVPEEIVKTASELVCRRALMNSFVPQIKDIISSRPKFKMSTDEASALRAAQDDDGGPISVGGFAVRHGLIKACTHPNAEWGRNAFASMGRCLECTSFLMKNEKDEVTIIADFTPDLGG